MSFFGKQYTLASQENFDKFVESLGSDVPANIKQALLAQKPTAKLVQDGDQYKLYSTALDGSTKELVFKSGVEFDDKLDGKDVKTTITVSGNVVTQVNKFGNGVEFNIKREFSDDQLVATITNSIWDGVAKRVYKA